MIMYEDDVVKYRKKSQHRPPKKSKHKHDYQPCLFSSPIDDFNIEKGHYPVHKIFRGTYCPKCGKIGEWNFLDYLTGKKITEEEVLTLPLFDADSVFMTKFVDLEENRNEKFFSE